MGRRASVVGSRLKIIVIFGAHSIIILNGPGSRRERKLSLEVKIKDVKVKGSWEQGISIWNGLLSGLLNSGLFLVEYLNVACQWCVRCCRNRLRKHSSGWNRTSDLGSAAFAADIQEILTKMASRGLIHEMGVILGDKIPADRETALVPYPLNPRISQGRIIPSRAVLLRNSFIIPEAYEDLSPCQYIYSVPTSFSAFEDQSYCSRSTPAEPRTLFASKGWALQLLSLRESDFLVVEV